MIVIPEVSIIVPIYNVEKYLDQCVQSLRNQTLEDIEILLVDDGSPDQSGKMADGYALADERVKVVHQRNAGLGPARNAGIEIATGEYIAFVDSDDWVNLDMYEKLYHVASGNKADIVVSGHCDMVNGMAVVKKVHPLAGKTFRSTEEIMRVRKNLYGHSPDDTAVEAFPMSVCMSLYKRSMIVEHNLRFMKILSEDTIFNLLAYQCARAITFTSYTDYCYRKEEQASITQSFSKSKLHRYQEFLETLFELAESENDMECSLRAKKMAIDYCRLYVGIVDHSNDSFRKKKEYVREFVQKDEIKKCWEGYPMDKLPFQQRIFHIMLEKNYYGVALFMSRLRQAAKRRKRISYMVTRNRNFRRVTHRIFEELRSTRDIARVTSWSKAIATLRAKIDIQIMNRNGYYESASAKTHLLKKHDVMIEYYEKTFSDFLDTYSFERDTLPDHSDMSDCIWVCWWQGEDCIPPLVRRCIESIKMHAGNHPVILLTENNYKDYVHIPEWVEDKKNKGMITLTNYSDLLRLSLLAEHGGMWLDATFFCTDDCLDEYFQMPIWSIKRPDYAHASVASGYFAGYSLACDAKHRWVFATIRDYFLNYWRNMDSMVDYLMIDYMIVLAQKYNVEISEAFKKIPENNPLCDELFKALNKPYDAEEWRKIKKDTSLFKLTWKQEFPTERHGKETFYAKLLSADL